MRPFLRYTLLLLAVLALAAAMSLVWMEPAGNVPSTPASPAASQREDTSAVGLSDAQKPSDLVFGAKPPTVSPQLPASLSGTTVPTGWRVVDEHGNLIATAELRAMFEYYLSALGEESLPQLIVRIEQALQSLAEPARGQARETLAAYLDYKLAVSELEASYGAMDLELSHDQLVQRMREVQGLRRAYLDGPTVDAFFGADEAVDRFQLARMAINQNQSLSPEQRAERLAQAEAGLPESMRAARQQSRQFEQYQQAQQALADDPAALRRYRESTFGVENAEKLAQVEREQLAWKARWSAYRDDVQSLRAAGLAEPEWRAAIDRLRAQYFDGPERARAEALDSIQ
ncbi:lipase secretion chaperone [Marinobacter caseinilyticus]|uniref:lipase secretion chaperone n=1 Tax=Marinobacter caseinilyticus TaxID=2692195 RepID=UPI00140D5203|nr:lipase secretion chaperone [Marinobacter caseinilyticus]